MSLSLPLVLIPGRMSTHVSWRYQIDGLGGERPIMLPGGHYDLSSIRDMAHSIARCLPERFDLAAWSMGGYILFELFPLIRHRINRLILVATSARPEDEATRAGRLRLLAETSQRGLAAVQRESLELVVENFTALETPFIDALHRSALQLGPDIQERQTWAIIGRRDNRDMLGSIDVETLMIVGENDRITPPDCAQEIARTIPSCQLRILPRTGHCPPYERPDEVNQLFRSFLNGHSPV